MKTCRMKWIAGGRGLAEAKIHRGIFLGDVLSPLLFLIAIMPLNHILRKCTAGYKLSRSQVKNQSPNVHGWHQTICKRWEIIANSNTRSQTIESGDRNGIWHGKMCQASNEKWQMTSN